MKILAIVFLAWGLFQCTSDENKIKCSDCPTSAAFVNRDSNENECTDCTVSAIVKDLTGLDGCGLVFELADGTHLIPEHRTYIQPPKAEEDPLYYFELKAGAAVRISYEESPSMSACMAGKTVFITCIKSCE